MRIAKCLDRHVICIQIKDSLFDDENSVDRSSSSKPKEHVSGQAEHTNLAVNNRSVSR